LQQQSAQISRQNIKHSGSIGHQNIFLAKETTRLSLTSSALDSSQIYSQNHEKFHKKLIKIFVVGRLI
jgi:hypothetical protein